MGYASYSLSFFRFGSCFLFYVFLLRSPAAASARFLRLPSKPDPKDAVGTARWLVGQSFWGVLSTISSDQGGSPFGNVVSFSDGLPGNGRGIPYFYLTKLDPTARDALKDERSSFTVSEYPLGTCGKRDPENPACAKLTLTGKILRTTQSGQTDPKFYPVIRGILLLLFDVLYFNTSLLAELWSGWLKLVDNSSAETEFAKTALFSKHPEMEDWPTGHDFKIFRLDIENIFLIDWFGGPKPITPAQYLKNETNEKYSPLDLLT